MPAPVRTERLELTDDEEDSPRTVNVEYRPLTGRGATSRMTYFALVVDGQRVGTLTEKCAPSRVRITNLRQGAARILGAVEARPVRELAVA